MLGLITRGVAEGAAAAGRRRRASRSTMSEADAMRHAQRLGRPAAADLGERLARQRRCGCASPARRPRWTRRATGSFKRYGAAEIEPEAADAFWAGMREQTDASSPATSRCGDCRCPRRRAGPDAAGAPADRVGRRAALAAQTDATRDRRCARRRAAPAAHATLFRGGDKSAGVFEPLRRAAGRAAPAPEAGVRSRGHLQSRPHVPGISERWKPISPTGSRAPPTAIEAESILRKCVHCGFCTATCPTYQLLGDELDGPRGRIYLIKQVVEGKAPTASTLGAPGSLPDLPQLRDHLSVGRAVRSPGRHRPQDRRGARHASARCSAWCAASARGPDASLAVRSRRCDWARRCARCCRRRCATRCRSAATRAPGRRASIRAR